METAAIIKLIMFYSSMYGVDYKLAMSIVQVESQYNINAVGPVGEIGLFQIRPEYVSVSRKALFNPQVNVLLGIQKLAEKKAKCVHKADKTWVICYNRGVYGGSKVTNPYENTYYKKVMIEYNKMDLIERNVANEN